MDHNGLSEFFKKQVERGMNVAEKVYTITDESGLHARPSTILVNTANKFASDVNVEYEGKTVNLKSVMGVLSLGVISGAQLKVVATGLDEEELLSALTEAMKENNLISE
jgi:phosphocarrier protein HPr